jgi:hypothetical protein
MLLALSRPVVWYALDDLCLRSGTVRAGERLPSAPRLGRLESEAGAASTLHCIGACEAAARVVAVLLGFKDAAPQRELDLR